jgi:hypothetical protein
MIKDKIIRVRITGEQLEGIKNKVTELKQKFPNRHISVGVIIRFLIHCFLKETCCISKIRLDTIMSYEGMNHELVELM